MKIFSYMGRNDDNVSGFSYKIWKVERRNRTVTVWFGPAILKSRRPVPAHGLTTRSWTFKTENAAVENERLRVREKENEGYQRIPRRRKSR